MAGVGDLAFAPLEARVWSAPSGRVLAALLGHDRRIHSVGFAPGGRDAVTATMDGTIRWWETSPRDLTRLLLERGLTHAAFRPDGTEVLVVTAGDSSAVSIRPQRMEVRNARTGAQRLGLDLPAGSAVGAWWSPDGRVIAVSDHLMTHFFDAASGKRLDHARSIEERVLAPLDLHRDGRHLLAASSQGLLVLDLETMGPTATFPLPAEARRTHAAVYHAAGERLLSIHGRGEVRAWDAVSGSETARWTAGPGAAAFSPGGRFLATGGEPGREDVVQVWSVSSRKETGRFGTAEWGTTWLLFSPDGRYLFAALFAGPGRLYDVGSGAELLTVNRAGRPLLAACFLPGGRHIRTISTDGVVRTWPLDPLREALERRPRALTAKELAEYEIERSFAPPRTGIDPGAAAGE